MEWPEDLDALVAAPRHHTLLSWAITLENVGDTELRVIAVEQKGC
jgi:hypothetical protein